MRESLPLLKALSDETRFRCYELMRDAGRPLSVADVAAELGLHPNTIRPHLERLREVGLIEVTVRATGSVGRPQHQYRLVPGAPSIGLGRRNDHLLAELLAALASRLSRKEDAVAVGREWGRYMAAEATGDEPSDPADVLIAVFDALGFNPTADGDCVTWGQCPFRDLAEAYPELICSLHRGLCEGLIDGIGGASLAAFHPLDSRTPCTIELVRT